MAVNFDAVLNLSKAGLMNPEQMGYKDSLEIIKDESVKIQKSFVKIGWYLKHIKDDELYKEDGYANINECAADQLGYSQSTVSRLINICEKFSKNHNSPELDDKYAGFDKSQMIEMLPMEPEQLERVKPDMTVKQIRDIKDEGKISKNDTKESDEDSTIPGQTSIERDFPEYMPSEPAIFDDSEEENDNQKYAMSHKGETVIEDEENILDEAVIDGQYREVDGLEEAVILQTDDAIHDERWFVEQYVKFAAKESAELMEICRREKNNSDRAKAIQKNADLYGYYDKSCWEYSFEFHKLSEGVDICIGEEEMHLTYERFALELMRIAERDIATSQSEKSAYGLEKTEHPEGSLLTTEGCGHKHNCFSCAQDCNIRQKDRYCALAPFGNPFPCTTMAVLGNLKEELEDKCQFVNNDLAPHTAGSGEADPCCRTCQELCGYRCQRAPLKEEPSEDDTESQEYTDQESDDDVRLLRDMLKEAKRLLQDYLDLGDFPELTVRKQRLIVGALANMVCELEKLQEKEEAAAEMQQELPLLKNDTQRKQWLSDYKVWGIWYRDVNIDVIYYKFDFFDGSRLVVTEYPQRHSYYSNESKDEHYYHLLKKNAKRGRDVYDEKYRCQPDCETELVKFLKSIQKKER